MRLLLILPVVLSVSGCAYFQPAPATNSAPARPVYTTRNAEASYDLCIKNAQPAKVDLEKTPEKTANDVVKKCKSQLQKIAETFGRTLRSNVKQADPVATGKLYAEAYEGKTKKALIAKFGEEQAKQIKASQAGQ